MAVPVLSSVAATPGPGSVTLSWNTDVAAETHVSMWLRPVKGATWDWQIGRASAIDQSGGAQVYDIDGFDKDAAAVSSLHGTNKLAIAYFSGGTAENWRSDYGSFPAGVKGPELQDWPNEYWLDIRTLSTLEPIMANRASIAAAKGFDGIEWDNVDGFDQGIDIGFPVTGANQLAYNQMLARIAHQYGLFAMLKNDAGQQAALQPYFDGVITEEAKRFADDYSAFPSNNKPWYDAEYRAQDMACSTYNALGCSQIKTTLSLDNPPTIQCVTSPPAQANLAKSAPIHDTSLTTGHSKTFSGLTPGQSYGFLVWSKNASGSTYSTLLYATPSAGGAGVAPVNTAAPVLSGSAQVGQTLTCSTGAWTGTPTPSYAYQWKRGGANIAGEVGATHVVASADLGQALTCTVTATNASGSASATSGTLTPTAAPVNTAAPALAGTPATGQTLSCSTGTWTGDPTPTFAYRWKRAGVDIGGATASSYVVVSGDVGHALKCTVTATNAQASVAADSNTVMPVAATPPTNTAAPVLSGSPVVGEILTCSRGSWGGSPEPSLAFQWKRDGVNIPGAAASTYRVATADVDHALSCAITASNASGSAAAASGTLIAVRASGVPPAASFTPAGERLRERTEQLAPDDEDFDLAHTRLTQAMVFGLTRVAEAYDPPDPYPPLGMLLDVDACPPWALRWLAQFVGQQPPQGLGDDELRAYIKDLPTWRRGSPAAMRDASRRSLDPAGTMNPPPTIFFRERDTGDPYLLEVVTLESQTPNEQRVRDAIATQKPAGLILQYRTVAAWDYEEHTAEGGTYGTPPFTFATYERMTYNDRT
jgi:hypothetical protein